MILKFKYHSDTGLLEAYQSYTLAQNSSNSDSVVITSTASDADRYDYCLEFVCYNSKNIPKAQYITPILHYNEGITFTLPNNITEYKGHVDMQLTGYLPEDNSVVFKSIAKNCKAFDVEGSLNVLESDLGETPNVLTEVMKELDALNNIHEEIVQNARDEFEEICESQLANATYRRVRFFVTDTLVKSCYVIEGDTVSAPEAQQSEDLQSDEKWYDVFDDDEYSPDKPILADRDYCLNVYSKGIQVDERGYLTGFTPQPTVERIVFPQYVAGVRFAGFDKDGADIAVDGIKEVYVSATMTEECCLYKFKSAVETVRVHPCNRDLYSEENVLYSQKSFVYYPSAKDATRYYVKPGISVIKTGALINNPYISTLILSRGLKSIEADAVEGNAMLERIYLPYTLEVLAIGCMQNNGASTANAQTKIFVEGDICDAMEVNTFGTDNNSYMLYLEFEDALKYTKKLGTYGVKCNMIGAETMSIFFEAKF